MLPTPRSSPTKVPCKLLCSLRAHRKAENPRKDRDLRTHSTPQQPCTATAGAAAAAVAATTTAATATAADAEDTMVVACVSNN